jgi:hypothetical protein
MDFFSVDLLDLQENFLFILCIYEFYLDFNDYLFNVFNSTFFSKSLIYVNEHLKNKKKDIKQPFNFLTSTYFSFCLELLDIDTNKKISNKTLYKYYKI